MTIHPDVISSLNSLPCFTEIDKISLVTDGLSHTCLKVITTTQVLFAKKLNSKTADVEVNAVLACAGQGISPHVIYHDKQWLVTEFVEGKTLVHEELELDSKIAIALKLMASCHHLSTVEHVQSIPSLDTRQSVNALLINPTSFIAPQRDALDKVTRTLTDAIESLMCKTGSMSVLCHGDINFTNILLGEDQRSWLVDFECAHRAPVEFDLAMFIAVNNVPKSEINFVINCYEQNAKLVINKTLLNLFLLFCCIINGLWYYNQYQNAIKEKNLLTLAKQQWLIFDEMNSKYKIVIAPRLSTFL